MMKKILLLLATACMFMQKAAAQNIDINILKAINPTNPDSQYWIQTSNSAYWVPVAYSVGTLAYGIIKKDKQAKIKACEAFISFGSAIVFTELLKPIINR